MLAEMAAASRLIYDILPHEADGWPCRHARFRKWPFFRCGLYFLRDVTLRRLLSSLSLFRLGCRQDTASASGYADFRQLFDAAAAAIDTPSICQLAFR